LALPGRYTRDGVTSAGSRGSEHASDEEAKRDAQLFTQPNHLPRDGGPAFWYLGALLTFKATSEQTAA